MIKISELHVPRMQVSFDSDIILPLVGEETANRWGLQIIRSILSRGTLFPETRKTTYIIELRPQAEFFGVFDPEDLIDEIESVSLRYAQESILVTA